MSLLPVLTYPDKRLRIPAKPVETMDERIQQAIKDMYETMYHDQGVGLAATQVNIPWRLFVMDISAEQNTPICMINPEIIHHEGSVLSKEGCLSLPDISISIKRYETITTRYLDSKGETQERTSTGLECMCIQHELDHLNGILAIDHLSKLKQSMLIKKMAKHQRA